MSERFFVQCPVDGQHVVLTGPEAHHLAHVMRARPGDRVILFDGTGVEYVAVVAVVRRDQVELRVLEGRHVDREVGFPLTLAVALPKGQRQHWLVEKAVELGVTQFVPLLCDRSVAKPTQHSLDRLRRVVIEASKQCGRNRLMEITPPQQCTQFCRSADSAALRMMAHPQPHPEQPRPARPGTPQATADRSASFPHVGPVDSRSAEQTELATPSSRGAGCPPADQPETSLVHGFILAVGPEGGFTDDEVAVARQNGWQIVELGSRTLRVETACVMLVCWALTTAGAALSFHY